jgi:adenosylhomocysteine nucleosidase
LTQLEAKPYLFFQGGWGKIAAAAWTQYVIDRWRPKLLVNLGTCGGFEGRIERGEILLVEKTIVYDITEQMGDAQQAIDHYSTEIDLTWLGEPYPLAVQRSLLVSGDRDLMAG